jgi:hypothetical protein
MSNRQRIFFWGLKLINYIISYIGIEKKSWWLPWNRTKPGYHPVHTM